MDPGSQRRQGDHRAVFRPQEPLRTHRRTRRGQERRHLKPPAMKLEYFQLIDRIVDLNLNDKTITVEARVPTTNTIFEGHFPGHPLMPGVLLIESMAQASGWLLLGLL